MGYDAVIFVDSSAAAWWARGVPGDVDGRLWAQPPVCGDDDPESEWKGDLTNVDVRGFCDGRTCRSIRGDLTLIDSNLTDLTALSCLQALDGMVYVQDNRSLTSLSGLEGLRTVAALNFFSNERLESLDGLRGLTVVDGPVSLGSNAALTTLSGLEGLETIELLLDIRFNGALADVTALHGLSSVGGDVSVQHNRKLTNRAAEDLVDEIGSIGGTVTVGDNQVQLRDRRKASDHHRVPPAVRPADPGVGPRDGAQRLARRGDAGRLRPP